MQWPKVNGKLDDSNLKPQSRVRGRWQDAPAPVGRWKRGVRVRAADSPFSAKVCCLEAALAALGPEESVAKTEIASALKRVREQEVASVRVDPDAKVVAARDIVARLEQAIAAMGDFKGPEMDTRLSAETSAERCTGAASGRADPSEGSIHRKGPEENRSLRRGACSRSFKIRGEREAVGRTEGNATRTARSPPAPGTEASSEVARLQQTVMDLQKELGQHVPGNPAVVSPFRVRKREDYVPATEQEVMEWMTDRQEEMNAALLSGNPSEAARISGLITEATRSLQQLLLLHPW